MPAHRENRAAHLCAVGYRKTRDRKKPGLRATNCSPGDSRRVAPYKATSPRSVKPLDIRAPLRICEHPTAHIMRRGHNRNGLLRYINAKLQTPFINRGKTFLKLCTRTMRNIEKHTGITALLQLAINRPRNHIPRRKRPHLVIIGHKRPSRPIHQNTAMPAHRFRNQK